MKLLTDAELQEAISSLAVANTPLFLMRKLRADEAVIQAAKSNTAEELIAAIKYEASKPAESAADYVRPYAYLVALSMSSDLRNLDRVAEFGDLQGWDWFDYIRRVLRDTTIPTENSFVREAQLLQNSIVGHRTDSTTLFIPITYEVKENA